MIKVRLPSKKPFVAVLIIVGVLTLAAVPSYYFYDKYQKSQQLLKNPTEAARAEVQALTAQVGKYIELPNEEPTVATVSDKEKLKGQAFFAKAKNGDKVLIYTQAKKAILYRPATNKIIDVAPINIGQGQQASQQQTTKVALYNGTTTVGLTNVIEKQLREKLTNVEVVAKENASKDNYGKTIVVDLSGQKQQAAEQLAKLLGGEVSKLPATEVKPDNADILIILGK